MDKYIKVKKIGEGSFGKALLVKSKANGKHMVIKEINMGKMGRKERDDSRKEVAVLAQLNHPNIVAYRESFEGDLYSRINTQRGVSFSEDQVLDWFVQICLSIKHIHDRKILHRDIKSQNIFLTKHGIVKLGDFGIAKVLNSTVELARTCIGTPYYLSPEICENRPYNNKSDVWSLGCVVYEMCTLKHAFEAGNMKNLVLKIIRGSYPPLPNRYSYDLRGLVAQLFKRNPRDRPSINAVLRKPLLQNRIKKFLNDSELADEFSHTVMHGCKVRRALPPGANLPQPVRVMKPTPVKRAPVAATPRYNPANVYGPSVVRKSKEKDYRIRKSSDGRRPGEVKRPSSASNDIAKRELARKRQELIDRENRRKEQAKRDYAQAQKGLQAKQKQNRMNKAREDGWRNMVDSLSSDDSSIHKPPSPKEKKPDFPHGAGLPMKDRGNFEQYHEFLNKLEQDRKSHHDAAYAARQGEIAGAKGAEAARVANEYHQRKKEAAQYKARGQADMYGKLGVAGAISPRINDAYSARERKEKQEQEYLAKLRQIRLHNFNERRNVVDNFNQPKREPVFKDKGSDVRRKKIEALRAQADDRAKKLRAELEKKRKEAYDKEHLRLRDQGKTPAGKPGHPPAQHKPLVLPKPSPAMPMTKAMAAIGAVKPAIPVKSPIGMTAAMNAIGVSKSTEIPESRSPLQKKKQSILKRLNSKNKHGAEEESASKWSKPEPVKLDMEEKSKWDESRGIALGQMSLEETASHMDATGTNDKVIKHDDIVRRQWSKPGGTVLNALAQADVDQSTCSSIETIDLDDVPMKQQTENGGKIDEHNPELDVKGQDGGKLGSKISSTITIVKNPAGKGTIVIRKEPENVGKSTDSKTDEPDNDTLTDPTVVNSSDLEIVEELSHQSGSSTHTSTGSSNGQSNKSPLFDKVQLEDDNDGDYVSEKDQKLPEDKSQDGNERKSSKHSSMHSVGSMNGTSESSSSAGVTVGLSTGHFDVGDVQVLRTCSEPDLLKLTRRAEVTSSFLDDVNSSVEITRSNSLNETNDRLKEDSLALSEQSGETTSNEPGETTSNESKEAGSDGEVISLDSLDDSVGQDGESTNSQEGISNSQNSQEGSEDQCDDDDDDDLSTVRQSMMSLLLEEDAVDKLETSPSKKKKKSTKKGKAKKSKSKTKEMSQSEEPHNSDGLSLTAEDDLQTMKQTMLSLLHDNSEDSPKTKKKGSHVKPSGDVVHEESTAISPTSTMTVTETWQSDSGDDDFFEEDDSMFSELEEKRANLEEQLGCDVFLRAYKAVQAIHEDEDENMEEGITLIGDILGDKKQLYPTILQLVMADGVFSEDND